MKKQGYHLKKADVLFSNLRSLAAESRIAGLFTGKQKKAKKPAAFLLAIRREFEQSLILDALRRFGSLLLSLRLCTVGLLLLSCGIWTAAFHMIGLLLTGGGAPDISVLLFSAGVAISSLPLLFSKKTVSEGLSASRIAGFVLFGMLGLYRESFVTDKRRENGDFTAFILGIACGLLTLFVRPWTLLLLLAALCGITCIFRMPEAGLSILVAALPFAGNALLCAILVITWISYFVKLLLGRRSLRFGAADACLAVYGLVVLGGILFPVSAAATLRTGLSRLLALSTGLLVLQLVRSGKTALRIAGLFTASITVASLLGLGLYVRQGTDQFMSGHGFPFSTAQMTSVFPTVAAFACFVLLVFPFVPAFFSCAENGRHRIPSLLLLLVCGLCLALTWDVPAIVGAVFAFAVFLLLRKKHGWFGILILALITFGCLIPSGLYDSLHLAPKLFPDLPGRVTVARDYLRAVVPCLMVGAGSGSAAPAGLYRGICDSAYVSAGSSGSFYAQSLAENGIIGLVFLLLYLVCLFLLCRSAVRLGHGFDPEDGIGSEQLPRISEVTISRRLIAAGCASLAGLLLGGLLLDPFAVPSLEYCFFIVSALTGAVAQSALSRQALQLCGDRNDLTLVFNGKEQEYDG